ncbi:MAG: hypothetical protein GYA33_04995 [Thermogutta sp.]|nr:hypothetical protein [Thermogutta sp.]
MDDPWILLAAVAATALMIAGGLRAGRRLLARVRFSQARRRFHRHRENLEARFAKAVAVDLALDDPAAFDFDDEVTYIRDRSSGGLTAIVAVSLVCREEWLPQEDEEVRRRAGVALFRYDGQAWAPENRLLFNLTPREAVDRLAGRVQVIHRDQRRRSDLMT